MACLDAIITHFLCLFISILYISTHTHAESLDDSGVHGDDRRCGGGWRVGCVCVCVCVKGGVDYREANGL